MVFKNGFLSFFEKKMKTSMIHCFQNMKTYFNYFHLFFESYFKNNHINAKKID